MFGVTDTNIVNNNGLLPLYMQSGIFQSQFSSSQVVGTAGGVQPGWGGEGLMCLLPDPPLCQPHQAKLSAMWGGDVTTTCAPLYGSDSFYTSCWITQGKQQSQLEAPPSMTSNRTFML